jgi:PAS domain S-box-containing protein
MTRRRRSVDANLPLEEVAWLAGVASRIGAADDLETIGASCAAVLQRFVEFELTHLFLADIETGALRLVHAHGLSEEQRRREEVGAPNRAPGTVVRTGQPVTVRDAVFETDPSIPGAPRRAVIRSRLTLPVAREGETFGAFGLATTRPEGFDDHDRALLSFVCDMAAIAYHRLRSDHRAREQNAHHAEEMRVSALAAQRAAEREQLAADARRYTAALLDISRAPTEGLGAFLQAVTEVVANTLGVDRASVWRRAEGGLELLDLFERSAATHANGALLAERDFGPYFEALRTEEMIVAVDAHDHPATACFSPTYLTPLGIASMLDLPLRSFDGVRGVLCIETYEHRAWREDETRFGIEVANLVMQALELSARRELERDHAMTLAAERERLQALLASSAAIIHSARLPGFELDYVSDSYAAVLGFPIEQARQPDFWAESVHPEDRERMLARHDVLLTTGHLVSEYRHRHADGSWRWLRAEERVVRDEDDRPLRTVGATLDITSRHRDEVRLATLLAVQQLVSRVAATFLAERGAGIAEAVLACLEGLGRVTRARRTFVARVVDGEVTLGSDWNVLSGADASPDARARICADVAAAGDLLGRGVAHATASLTTAVERGLFLVPLVVDGRLRGVLGLDTPGLEEIGEDEMLALVERVADALATGQQRFEDEQELRALTARLERRANQQRSLLQLSGDLARASTRNELYALVAAWLPCVPDVDHIAFVEPVAGEKYRVRVFAHGTIDGGPFVSDDLMEATRDCAVTAAIERVAPVTTDEHALSDFSCWRMLAKMGLRQIAVVPLVGASDVLGALVIATHRDERWTVEDLSWAAQFGVLFGGHLSTLRARDALRQMNEELERRVNERTAELRASEERFELLFQSAPQAMVIADRAGRVVQANRGAQALFGYEDESFDGLPLATLLPSAARERHDQLVQAFSDEVAVQSRAMAAGRIVTGLRQDGTEFPAEIGLVPLLVRGEPQIVAGITDVSARVAAQEEVSRSLREKEVLLKEIHHRVKNNLQIISSLLMLQSDQMASDEMRRILHESVYRVRSMALIHQLFYGGHSLDRIDLGAYARALAASLASGLAPAAKVDVRADDVAVPVDVAVPLGLVLNELLTNAFKYGLPDGAGQARQSGADADVLVEVHVDGGDLQLAVLDRGPGLPEDLDFARASTLGLQLVRSLVRQLRGRLVVTRTPRARIALTCPIDPPN